MEKLLVEVSKTEKVNYKTVSEGFNYNTECEYKEGVLVKTKCNVSEEETKSYEGYMSFENANFSYNFPEKAKDNIALHIGTFNKIIDEAKGREATV